MKTLLTLAAFAALAAISSAQNFIGAGEFTALSPTFNRPISDGELSNVGTAVPYATQSFTVSTAGTYYIEQSSLTFDTYVCLYSDSFSAATPLVNLIGINDDYTSELKVLSGTGTGSDGALPSSEYGADLTTGTTYIAVFSAYSNETTGAFAAGIGAGPGNVVTAPVPEPATFAALGLGAVAMLRRRKRA